MAEDGDESLRAAIADLQARHHHSPPPGRPSALAGIVAKMDGDAADIGKRPGKDYDAIASGIASSLASRELLAQRKLRDGAWCLWETKPALAEDAPILLEFLGRCRAGNDKRVARSVLSAYLTQWQDDRPCLDEISASCTSLASVAGKQFAEAQDRYRLFSLPSGPEQLGRAAVERRRAPPSLLADLGFSDSIARGGFSLPCTRAALETAGNTQNLAPRERLDLTRDLALLPHGGLISPTLRAPFANALLLPYADQAPPEDVKQETLRLVLDKAILGDPRTQPGQWMQMETAAAIVRRWLVGETISQFLDVVDAVAMVDHWKWRRAFWTAVFDQDGPRGGSIVDDAWVVFDEDGLRQKARMGLAHLPAGRFHKGGGQVQSGQAVLLLRIGRLVVAEWSHNGTMRLWRNADRDGAPKLHQSWYMVDELRHGRKGYRPEWETTHVWSTTYSWQNKAADELHRTTGIRIPQSAYALK